MSNAFNVFPDLENNDFRTLATLCHHSGIGMEQMNDLGAVESFERLVEAGLCEVYKDIDETFACATYPMQHAYDEYKIADGPTEIVNIAQLAAVVSRAVPYVDTFDGARRPRKNGKVTWARFTGEVAKYFDTCYVAVRGHLPQSEGTVVSPINNPAMILSVGPEALDHTWRRVSDTAFPTVLRAAGHEAEAEIIDRQSAVACSCDLLKGALMKQAGNEAAVSDTMDSAKFLALALMQKRDNADAPKQLGEFLASTMHGVSSYCADAGLHGVSGDLDKAIALVLSAFK